MYLLSVDCPISLFSELLSNGEPFGVQVEHPGSSSAAFSCRASRWTSRAGSGGCSRNSAKPTLLCKINDWNAWSSPTSSRRAGTSSPSSFDLSKIRAKITPNVLTSFLQNRTRERENVLGLFSGKFGDIRTKTLRTPKNLPAALPVPNSGA